VLNIQPDADGTTNRAILTSSVWDCSSSCLATPFEDFSSMPSTGGTLSLIKTLPGVFFLFSGRLSPAHEYRIVSQDGPKLN
jgi:hypothetical protein